MNNFDRLYAQIITECSVITEADRATKVIAKVGGGLLGLIVGSKLGQMAGGKLGELIGGKVATEKATELLGERAVGLATGTVAPATGLLQKAADGLSKVGAETIINQGTKLGGNVGGVAGKAAGIAAGTYTGYQAGQYIEEKLYNGISSKNHDTWFVSMTKDGKNYWLTADSSLATEDPSKALVFTKSDEFTSDEDVTKKLADSGVFEALTDFDNVKVIGFENSKTV